MNLIEALNWRYATKSYRQEKVPTAALEYILEAVRLAPTSSGLEQFEVLVISNPDLKQRLTPIAFNQKQVAEASHILVFAAWDNYTPERINAAFDRVNEQRGFKNEGWENYRQFLLNLYPSRDARTNFEHAARQAYIAFGLAIAAAAEQKIDSTPVEGFDAPALDELLGLPAKGLKSVALLPIGFRNAEGDWLVNLKKVRRTMAEFATRLE
jgi:nitroreductase / dihydropteridine reductase